MFRIGILSLLFPIVCLGCGASDVDGPDESIEPSLTFIVNVGDSSVSVSEGKSAKVEGTFTDPTISVTPQPFRVFPYQGMTFKYPRSFTFEADFTDPDNRNWTLSGNNLIIMVFRINGKLTAGEFANTMIEQFGRENCSVTNANAKLSLRKETLTGTTIQITVATHSMKLGIYQVPASGSITKLLVFQDSLGNSGNGSTEGQLALEEIKKSFAITDVK